jgi:hypothetical protein
VDKFKSKKFWALVVTLMIAILGGGGIDPALGASLDLDPVALAVAGLLSGTYIIVQGRIDRATALGKAVEKLDLKQIKELLTELNHWDNRLPPPKATILPPREDDVPW